MSEANKPFVVTDRRKFTMDGSPRLDADPSPEQESREVPVATAAPTAPIEFKSPQAAARAAFLACLRRFRILSRPRSSSITQRQRDGAGQYCLSTDRRPPGYGGTCRKSGHGTSSRDELRTDRPFDLYDCDFAARRRHQAGRAAQDRPDGRAPEHRHACHPGGKNQGQPDLRRVAAHGQRSVRNSHGIPGGDPGAGALRRQPPTTAPARRTWRTRHTGPSTIVR